MYTTEEVVSGSIVGAYVGHVCHSFEVNNASDSIFQIGWYKQGFVQYLVLCDGNVIN